MELLAPEHYVAKLKEPAIPEDKDSSDQGGLPTFNAYSPDGDVTAQIVYVNYGMPDDYDKLAQMGIKVNGKIVLARYMGGWRGIKPKVAAEHGAIGCIIFSDPADDGFFQGDTYPNGPWRPEWGVQRGSTMDMPTYPGDPLSPGWGHDAGREEPGAERSEDAAEDSGAADFVGRRAADSAEYGRSGCAEGVARGGAGDLSRRAGPGAGPHGVGVRLEGHRRGRT